MIKTGYVIGADEKIVKIRVHRESACGGNCAHCNGCESGEVVIEAENIIGAKIGETVKILMEDKAFLKNTLWGYGALVFALILGGILGYEIFKTDFASAICAFSFLGIVLLIYRIGFKNHKTNIKIERFEVKN